MFQDPRAYDNLVAKLQVDEPLRTPEWRESVREAFKSYGPLFHSTVTSIEDPATRVDYTIINPWASDLVGKPAFSLYQLAWSFVQFGRGVAVQSQDGVLTPVLTAGEVWSLLVHHDYTPNWPTVNLGEMTMFPDGRRGFTRPAAPATVVPVQLDEVTLPIALRGVMKRHIERLTGSPEIYCGKYLDVADFPPENLAVRFAPTLPLEQQKNVLKSLLFYLIPGTSVTLADEVPAQLLMHRL